MSRFEWYAGFVVAALTTALLASPAWAQLPVPEQVLGRPELESSLDFTRVTSVAELSGDRAIVIAKDPAGPTLLSIRTNQRESIGRLGQGPGEWSAPSVTVAGLADSTYIFDQRRFVLMSFVPGGQLRDIGRVFGWVQQVDARGRGYYVGFGGAIAMAVAKTASGPAAMAAADALRDRRDSIAIVRADPRTGGADTIGYRRGMKGVGSLERSSPDGLPGMGGRAGDLPFWGTSPIEDLVAFGRDGRVAIIRQPEYRVDWIMPDGRRVAGPVIPHTDVRFSAADVKWFRFDQCYQPGMSCKPGPNGAFASQPLPETWPSARSVQVAPDGMLWVEHSRSVNDSVPVFDVIDERGMLARRVRLPDHTRLVGFGNGTVYAVRIDQDDLEYVQRYRLP